MSDVKKNVTNRTRQVNENRAAIEFEAKCAAERLARDQRVRTGFGAETAIENALLAMAIFAIGVATDQQQAAGRYLAEFERTESTIQTELNRRTT